MAARISETLDVLIINRILQITRENLEKDYTFEYTIYFFPTQI